MILGLDIGGANTKAPGSVDTFCQLICPSESMRLLDEVLCRLAAQKPQAEAVAVVITGELTDCIYPKKEGFESFLSHG